MYEQYCSWKKINRTTNSRHKKLPETMASTTSLTLTAPGPREVVDEKRANEIIDYWNKELAAASDESKEVVTCERVVLSNKSYTAKAAKIIHLFLTAEDTSMDYKQPLASTVKIVDLSDIIASRMEAEGLEVLQTICDAFKNASLEEVDLSDNAMGSKGVTACSSVLSGQSSSLERLLLCNNGLSEASMNEVADILCGGTDDGENAMSGGETICERLTKIHFYNNMSGNGGCRAFARIISKCSDKLEDIRFSGTRAGREGSLFISSSLENLGDRIINVRNLDLADNSFGLDGGSTLAKALRRCINLTTLNLRDCVLEDDATGLVCRALWTADAPIEKLDLSGNEVSRKGAKAIAELLEDCQSTLKVLHCEENEMTSKGVAYIAGSFGPKLEEIRLGFNECGSIGAMALVTACGENGEGLPALNSIALDGNMFPESDVGQLEDAFGDKLEQMEDNDDEGDADDDLSESDDDEEEYDEDDEELDEREFEGRAKKGNTDSIDKLAEAMGNTKIHDLV